MCRLANGENIASPKQIIDSCESIPALNLLACELRRLCTLRQSTSSNMVFFPFVKLTLHCKYGFSLPK